MEGRIGRSHKDAVNNLCASSLIELLWLFFFSFPNYLEEEGPHNIGFQISWNLKEQYNQKQLFQYHYQQKKEIIIIN